MKWYRLPDGSFLWHRGLDNAAYHYTGEAAEVVRLVLRYSR